MRRTGDEAGALETDQVALDLAQMSAREPLQLALVEVAPGLAHESAQQR